ncbi:hypothetical protein DWB77_00248 [Streptomyces hundungensis]|uniref:Uncharacterized protein n=1 Tax=Streptomyces hundungensis TaxID=1077946 RepID=A0A387H6G9_9ACTN|nr:hypothetical protein [Streptomyces hundungensis]AYG78141.1 hypothetical protein DWB77_00248 [Streptomyces hundungensis]
MRMPPVADRDGDQRAGHDVAHTMSFAAFARAPDRRRTEAGLVREDGDQPRPSPSILPPWLKAEYG